MKITQVKTFVVNVYRTNFVFVKLETDSGLSGVGEGTLEYKERALLGAVEDLKDYLIGQDPRLIEKHTFMMYRESYWRTGPVLMSAISAVEMAMWDILGKSCRMPVHALLGGAVRDEIKMYANGWFAGADTPEEFAARARAAVAKGVRALKWDPFRSAYLTRATGASMWRPPSGWPPPWPPTSPCFLRSRFRRTAWTRWPRSTAVPLCPSPRESGSTP